MAVLEITSHYMGPSTNGSIQKQGLETICHVRWVTFIAHGKELCMLFQNLKTRIPEPELVLKQIPAERCGLVFGKGC